jgi:hypothetical protein
MASGIIKGDPAEGGHTGVGGLGTSNIVYGRRGRIYRQADKSKVTVSKEGVAQATEEYQGLYADIVTQSPRLDDAHPDFPGLLLHTKSISRRREIGICVCDYRGLDPASESDDPEFLPPPVYELSWASSMEEIASHLEFKSKIVPAAGGEGPGKAVFNPETKLFEGFGKDAESNLAGVKSYFDPQATWTATFVTKTVPAQRGTLGKISNPPGPVPSYPGRNWLYTGMQWRREGGVYVSNHVWLLSSPQGWNTVLYGNT